MKIVFRIELSSVSLEPVTTFQDYRVLPINLTVSGDFDDMIQIIRHFENDTEGSYMVRGSSVEFSGTTANMNLVIYLCTPNV